MSELVAKFPPKTRFLFKPSRYKVLYGGRGSGKSWAMARALLLIGASKKLRVLCVREVQNSIAESVHKLLSQQIENLNLQSFYEIQNTTIFSKINGTEFIFEGIKHNITKIKSMEGIDVCWAEEAEAISDMSWDVLVPTIRKSGSEIWISFNPKFDDDATYVRFVSNPPANCVAIKMNWTDNKYISQELIDEKNDLKERDLDKYLWVWEGHCLKVLDGAVYMDEMRKMRDDGRISNVPYEPSKPVYTFWDLGFGDSTAIWFVQMVAMQYRVIDYIEDNRKSIDHYVRVIQSKPYVFERHYLPHDGRHANLATGKTIQEIVEGFGLRVEIVPQIGIDNGINAVRMAMPNVWIDENKCKEGIKALEYYHYETDKNGNRRNIPAHDWSSHGCDAFRYMAVAFKESVKHKPIKKAYVQHGWMG